MCCFQSCTVLLGLLFLYDVFFVFITPLFTKVCTLTETALAFCYFQLAVFIVGICTEFHNILRKRRNSVEMGKFHSLDQNPALCGKLLSLPIGIF